MNQFLSVTSTRKAHSAIDRRITRDLGFANSRIKRERVEQIFRWMKAIAGLGKTRHRAIARVGWTFNLRSRSLQPCADAQPAVSHHMSQSGEPPEPTTLNR
jgi:hypothetical protein